MPLPSFDDLPDLDGSGLRHAWDVLDRDLGSVGLMSPAGVTGAAQLVSRGEVVPLNLSLGLIDPPLFGREPLRHTVIPVGRNSTEDRLDAFNPQASSQWDGLRHVRARQYGFFGGIEEIPADDSETLSIEHWARTGIVGRGLLLDVASWRASTGSPLDPFAGEEITVADLEATASWCGASLQQGDVLCIRTGWVAAYRDLPPDERCRPELSTRFSGLRADEAMARYLWNQHLVALVADNPACEVAPGDPSVGYLHWRLLPTLGMAVGELLDLDRLAVRCQHIGRPHFLFVAVPLAVPGGVSSPANAVAIL